MNITIDTSSEGLLDIEGACHYLGVARTTFYLLRKSGGIPAVHLSDRCVRFRRRDLDEFIRRRMGNPPDLSITSSRS